jgi:trigger factor
MQITETLNEPLRREFTIVVGYSDLDEKLTGKITEMQPRIHLKGFRPGKAPVSFLKKTYGKSLMGEIVNDAINHSSEQLIKEKELKPATTPRLDLVKPLENVIKEHSDLEFTVKVDLMPEFELANLSELKAERLTAEVGDEGIKKSLERLAESQRTYSDKGEGAAAEKGDAVTIDFDGTINGAPFNGGKAEDFDLTLGSQAFLPGFEDQLLGVKAGDETTVKVSFPATYGAAELAGKEAEFAVKVKAVKAPNEVPINDELAIKVGMESLDQLTERVREQLRGEYTRASRTHLKRRILDALDTAHSFDLPPGMVDQEFNAIWAQVEAEMQREGAAPEDEGKSEEELKKEYREIAERRVRLGLVLAKIGEQNAIGITDEEVNRALAARARQFPGQEQQVIQYYTSNPGAMAELRVPLFEDKVIDFLGELVEVHDRKVAPEILFLDPDEAEDRLKEQAAAEKKPAKVAKQKEKSETKADPAQDLAETRGGEPAAAEKPTKTARAKPAKAKTAATPKAKEEPKAKPKPKKKRE